LTWIPDFYIVRRYAFPWPRARGKSGTA
jgi:hypothetical protein